MGNETTISVHSALLVPQGFAIDYESTIEVRVERTPDSTGFSMRYFKNGEEMKGPAHLLPGDRLVLKHGFHLNEDHPLFPMKIRYREQEYQLTSTRAGKLILTK